MAFLAEKIPLESEYPWEVRILLSMSRITSCGAENPNGYGLDVYKRQVMSHLKDLDSVAYVRFASVYREFKDVSTFMDELKKFLN